MVLCYSRGSTGSIHKKITIFVSSEWKFLQATILYVEFFKNESKSRIHVRYSLHNSKPSWKAKSIRSMGNNRYSTKYGSHLLEKLAKNGTEKPVLWVIRDKILCKLNKVDKSI